MIELERTFLAKTLPANLTSCESKKIVDMYIDNDTPHPNVRIRACGDTYEITKKIPVRDGDSSRQVETTIPLVQAEFTSLTSANVLRVEKTRYYYTHNDTTAEIDIFTGDLYGLVLVDFEFATIEEKDDFQQPDFCLVDITQEKFIAGGMLAGKTYADIQNKLETFGYSPLSLTTE